MNPPTYPARPINGGRLDKALPKTGTWFAEPKYNGWYAHGSPKEGGLFNRKNERLSITSEFKAALDIVKDLPFPWLTYEAMDRRHNLSRGSLLILDYPDRTLNYDERRRYMQLVCAIAHIPIHSNLNVAIPDNSVALVASYEWAGADSLYNQILPLCNKHFKCEYYEGIVAKRADSKYPYQLRSPETDYPFWRKHRWAF